MRSSLSRIFLGVATRTRSNALEKFIKRYVRKKLEMCSSFSFDFSYQNLIKNCKFPSNYNFLLNKLRNFKLLRVIENLGGGGGTSDSD